MARIASPRSPARVASVARRIAAAKLDFMILPCVVRSADAARERRLHYVARLQRAEYSDRLDRGAGELGRDIVRDAGQAKHPDVQLLTGLVKRLEVGAAIFAYPKFKRLPHDGLADGLGVNAELVAHRGPDEIAAIRIEPLADEEVDPS